MISTANWHLMLEIAYGFAFIIGQPHHYDDASMESCLLASMDIFKLRKSLDLSRINLCCLLVLGFMMCSMLVSSKSSMVTHRPLLLYFLPLRMVGWCLRPDRTISWSSSKWLGFPYY
jgi:hypothetical protein